MVVVYDRAGSLLQVIRGLALAEPVVRASDVRREPSGAHPSLFIAASLAEVPADHVDVDGMVITSTPNEDEALEALSRGLVGYVDASVGADALRRAIGECLAGGTAFPRRVLSRWLRRQSMCSRAHCNTGRLTSRQREIVDLIADGLADKEIAHRLNISTATAQKHVTNILERLHVTSRAAAVAAVCTLIVGGGGERRLGSPSPVT